MAIPSDKRTLSNLQRWAIEHHVDLERDIGYPGDHINWQQNEDDQDQGLSELAVPQPANRQPVRDSLEKRVREQESENNKDDDANLTEVDAPPPAEEKTSSGDQTPAPSEHGLEDEESRIRQEKKAEPVIETRRSATEIYTISWLIFFSFFGTLARLGVEAITTYPNSPFPSRVLWANLGGSFFMGFLAEDRRLFRQEWGNSSFDAAKHGGVKKTIPLYIGLATGFCGCFTSFSSFIRDSFLALTNDLAPPSPTTPYQTSSSISSRNGGFSLLAFLAILIIHPAVSLVALVTGAHFALLLQPITPTLPFCFTRRILDPLAVFLAFGCWLGAILLSIFPPSSNTPTAWRSRAVFPLVFAPLGCLARFYISKYLNPRISSFPLGTFVVNILGTAVIGMAYDLQHSRRIGSAPLGDATSCAVLQGVMEGFCGCLTTVSTWVAELKGLRKGHAWVYGGSSVAVGVGVLVVIMGSMGWTVGFGQPLCG